MFQNFDVLKVTKLGQQVLNQKNLQNWLYSDMSYTFRTGVQLMVDGLLCQVLGFAFLGVY